MWMGQHASYLGSDYLDYAGYAKHLVLLKLSLMMWKLCMHLNKALLMHGEEVCLLVIVTHSCTKREEDNIQLGNILRLISYKSFFFLIVLSFKPTVDIFDGTRLFILLQAHD